MGTIDGSLPGAITSKVTSMTAPSARAVTVCIIGNAYGGLPSNLIFPIGAPYLARAAASLSRTNTSRGRKRVARAGAQAATEETLGDYPTKLGHSIFFYRRGPEFIFNETQRYSFIERLSFLIQLLPALLHSAYDEYPVIDD